MESLWSLDVELEELGLLSRSDGQLSDNLGSDEDRICYEEDISSDNGLTAEEMAEDLDACLGLEQDEAFWDICKSSRIFMGVFF